MILKQLILSNKIWIKSIKKYYLKFNHKLVLKPSLNILKILMKKLLRNYLQTLYEITSIKEKKYKKSKFYYEHM